MTEVQKLAQRLFGPDGMGVKNFRFDAVVGATPEGIARSINSALDALERGEGEEIELDDSEDDCFHKVFGGVGGTVPPGLELYF